MSKKKTNKRRGAVYSVTSKGVKATVTGQGRLILLAIKRMGKATAKQVRSRVGKNLKTENVPASVIGVYLGRFRRAGLLAAKIPAKA